MVGLERETTIEIGTGTTTDQTTEGTIVLCMAIAVLDSFSYMSRVICALISILHIAYTSLARLQVH